MVADLREQRLTYLPGLLPIPVWLGVVEAGQGGLQPTDRLQLLARVVLVQLIEDAGLDHVVQLKVAAHRVGKASARRRRRAWNHPQRAVLVEIPVRLQRRGELLRIFVAPE